MTEVIRIRQVNKKLKRTLENIKKKKNTRTVISETFLWVYQCYLRWGRTRVWPGSTTARGEWDMRNTVPHTEGAGTQQCGNPSKPTVR